MSKTIDICRANEATQSHMKVFCEKSEVAVNKLIKTKLTKNPTVLSVIEVNAVEGTFGKMERSVNEF